MIINKRKEEKEGCKRQQRRKSLYNFKWVHIGSRVFFHIFLGSPIFCRILKETHNFYFCVTPKNQVPHKSASLFFK